jgi:hypothetical protein
VYLGQERQRHRRLGGRQQRYSLSTDFFTGAVAAWAAGIDPSVATSALAATCLYLALERGRPSARAV